MKKHLPIYIAIAVFMLSFAKSNYAQFGNIAPEPFVDFSSGYFQRSMDSLPKQGSKAPWTLHQNYARDLLALRYGKVDDGTLAFTKAPAKRALTDA